MATRSRRPWGGCRALLQAAMRCMVVRARSVAAVETTVMAVRAVDRMIVSRGISAGEEILPVAAAMREVLLLG